MHKVSYAGVDFDIQNAYIVGQNQFAMPKRSVDVIPVQGLNGSLTIDNGSYEDIEVPYTVIIMKNVEYATNELKKWLYPNYGYNKLIDDVRPNLYRWARVAEGFEVPTNDATKIVIPFVCKPFLYQIDNNGNEPKTTITTFATSRTLTNPYQYESRPLINIRRSGSSLASCIIDIEGQSLNVQNIDSKGITIDTELQEATTIPQNGVVTENKNSSINTADIELKKENNIISVTVTKGSLSSVEIYPRWRTL